MADKLMRMSETNIEWAVQYRTYIGGQFARTVPYDDEGKARAQVEKFNKGKPEDQHARVAYRYVTNWIKAKPVKEGRESA
jgi:hypothetical protein